MEPFLERVRAGEDDPRCTECGGIIKSGTILFGEPLVPAVIDRAMRAARGCDLLLAVGTTLSVYPVAAMVPTAVRAGAAVIIVNGSATDLDDLADVVVRATIGEVLPALVSGLTPR
jgi:NAD-dependent deacetylase